MVFDDRVAEIHAAFGDLKTSYEAKIAEEKARADEAEKKLQDMESSTISAASFDEWATQFIADIKGAMQ